MGTIIDPYDNALTETVNGLYKAEPIHAQGLWTSVGEVELETLQWVHWRNVKRLHKALDYAAPQEEKPSTISPSPSTQGRKEAELNPGRFTHQTESSKLR